MTDKLKSLLDGVIEPKQFAITHDQEPGTTVDDHHPLTFEEVRWLLTEARERYDGVHKHYHERDTASIQVRLGQGIPGMTSPHPASGEVADRIAELNEKYVDWLTSGEPVGDEITEAIWIIVQGDERPGPQIA